MHLSPLTIGLDAIEFSPKWSLHPWSQHNDAQSLCHRSLDSVGILHPPLVKHKDESTNTSYEVVCGYQRLLFARKQWPGKRISCLVLPEDTDPQQLLLIILQDQSRSGNRLSLAEKARFIEIASRFYNDETIYTLFGKHLNLHKKRPLFKCLQKLLSQDQTIIDSVHQESIQEHMLLDLMRLQSVDDRLSLVKIFRQLQLGAGKQRRLFQLIRDAAYKPGLSISKFLKSSEIQHILKHDTLNVPQKIQHLNEFLLKQVQPDYLKAEKQFDERVRLLNLPSNMSITHVPFFEKDDVTLSITFDNFDECTIYLKKFQKQ